MTKQDLQQINQLLQKNNQVLKKEIRKELKSEIQENNKILKAEIRKEFRSEIQENNKILRSEIQENNHILRKEIKSEIQENNKILRKEFKSEIQENNKILKEAIIEETAMIVNKAFQEMEEKIKKEFEKRPTKQELFDWADKRIYPLELDQDRLKFLHIKEWKKLPSQREITGKLAEEGLN